MTTSEVIKIQRILGLPQDGIAGKKTSQALKLFKIKRQVRMKSINIIFNETI